MLVVVIAAVQNVVDSVVLGRNVVCMNVVVVVVVVAVFSHCY